MFRRMKKKYFNFNLYIYIYIYIYIFFFNGTKVESDVDLDDEFEFSSTPLTRCQHLPRKTVVKSVLLPVVIWIQE